MIALAGFTEADTQADCEMRRHALEKMSRIDADLLARMKKIVVEGLKVGGDPVDVARSHWILSHMEAGISPAKFLSAAQVDELWLWTWGGEL